MVRPLCRFFAPSNGRSGPAWVFSQTRHPEFPQQDLRKNKSQTNRRLGR